MQLSLFASGSSGNCALLRFGRYRLLLDAGISARAIRNALADAGTAPSDLDGILITHEHSDHVSGLSVLLKHDPLPVFAPGTVASCLCAAYSGVESCLHAVEPERPFSFGDASIVCFPTPHDTPQSVGWRIETPEGVFALATDTGHVTSTMLRYLGGADIAVIEANHDERMLREGPYPFPLKRRVLSDSGHLSNTDCAALARRLAEQGTHQIVLAHLSRENNRPEIARDTVLAALAGTQTELYVAPARERMDIEVQPCFAYAYSAKGV